MRALHPNKADDPETVSTIGLEQLQHTLLVGSNFSSQVPRATGCSLVAEQKNIQSSPPKYGH